MGFFLKFSFSFVVCCCLEAVNENKILICGVCKDVEFAVSNTIENIENLGGCFSDYAVIIYENNSRDKTPQLFSNWCQKNPRVRFISEHLRRSSLKSREENIARARNIALSVAKEPAYDDFKYLLMVDFDFQTPWPIDEIVRTIELPFDWDCISANGIINRNNSIYWDRYALRNAAYPFGPELLGEYWWVQQNSYPLVYPTAAGLIPVYSAFGGMAVYKRETVTKFHYSGTPTEDLTEYYRAIYLKEDKSNQQIKNYLDSNALGQKISFIPIIYKNLFCCEHVTLHASMAKNGFNKFYINPKMVMVYDLRPKEFKHVKIN